MKKNSEARNVYLGHGHVDSIFNAFVFSGDDTDSSGHEGAGEFDHVHQMGLDVVISQRHVRSPTHQFACRGEERGEGVE